MGHRELDLSDPGSLGRGVTENCYTGTINFINVEERSMQREGLQFLSKPFLRLNCMTNTFRIIVDNRKKAKKERRKRN